MLIIGGSDFYLHSVEAPTSEGDEMNVDVGPFSRYPNTYWNRGTQFKNATSCGNNWVTNITLAQSLRRMSRIFKGMKLCRHNSKSGRNYAKAKLIWWKS